MFAAYFVSIRKKSKGKSAEREGEREGEWEYSVETPGEQS